MIPSLTTVALGGGVTEALSSVPAVPGVGQILGPAERNLLLGRPANLRRWASSHLGAGRARKSGGRPPVDLRPVASAVAYAQTTSAFHQRLLFERLMGRHVAPSARRDLKPPSYLRLDLTERFPRILSRSGMGGAPRGGLYGPFRNRAAADRTKQALEKAFRLRPCDYAFEPHPALPLGLGCVYAQVASCAAPCLARVREDEYRALARQAAGLLAGPAARPAEGDPSLPPWIADVEASYGLVAVPGLRGLELYPVASGGVFEEGGAVADGSEGADAVAARLEWSVSTAPREDAPWVSAWLYAPRRVGAYLVFGRRPAGGELVEALRSAGLGTPWER